VIAAFHFGIDLSGAGVGGTTIEGNFVGVDKNATSALPNAGGINIRELFREFHWLPGARWRQCHFGQYDFGVGITNGSGNYVTGNFIGTNKAGAGALSLPNQNGILSSTRLTTRLVGRQPRLTRLRITPRLA